MTMPDITLTAAGISCDHCKRTIETELAELPGVHQVHVEPPVKSVHAVFDDAVVDETAILTKLDDIGYPVSG
jgi:copper chaperone CopZ